MRERKGNKERKKISGREEGEERKGGVGQAVYALKARCPLTLSNSTHGHTRQSPSHTPHLGHRGEGIPPCTVPGLDTKKVAVLHLPIK